MKKISLLWLIGLLTILPLGFTACDDDDEGSREDLFGVWESVRVSWCEKEDGKVTHEGNEADATERMELKADGTFISSNLDKGEWHTSETGTWEFKNGKIYVQLNGSSESRDEAKVTALTKDVLVLEFYEKFTEGGVVYEDYSKTEYRKIK